MGRHAQQVLLLLLIFLVAATLEAEQQPASLLPSAGTAARGGGSSSSTGVSSNSVLVALLDSRYTELSELVEKAFLLQALEDAVGRGNVTISPPASTKSVRIHQIPICPPAPRSVGFSALAVLLVLGGQVALLLLSCLRIPLDVVSFVLLLPNAAGALALTTLPPASVPIALHQAALVAIAVYCSSDGIDTIDLSRN
jgi:hypothetical protein